MEKEATIWCPQCKALYGELFRVPVNDTVWTHVTKPETVPPYCSVCEIPTERKR